MKWTSVKLHDICRAKQWKTISISNLKESGFPVYGANGQIGFYDKYTHEKSTLLITCRGATCGTINICEPYSYVTGNSMALDDLDETRANQKYLYHYLRKRRLDDVISGSAQPQITRDGLKKVEIPLPPIAEQKRIAAILDKAEELRGLRRKALGELDAIVQSIFLEMFGNPVINPKGWLKVKLGSVGAVQGGLQISASRAKLPCKVPYLRVANVYRDTLDLSEIKMMSATESEVARSILKENDLLIVEGHGNPSEIGRCALWNGSIPKCVHQNHLIRLRFDLTQVNPVFVSRYLNSTGGRRDLLRSGKTTSGLNTINVSNVRDVQLLLPPLSLQQEFAQRVKAIEHLKATHRESLAQLDALYTSLQHRAFRGEL